MAKNNFKEFFTLNNAIYMAAVVLAFFLVWQTTLVILDNYDLQKQVDSLEDEVALLELENQKLSFDIEYYKTDSYLDLAARENFNLKSPGEKVVYVKKSDNSQENKTTTTQEQAQEEPVSNFQQWLDFFTGRSRL